MPIFVYMDIRPAFSKSAQLGGVFYKVGSGVLYGYLYIRIYEYLE